MSYHHISYNGGRYYTLKLYAVNQHAHGSECSYTPLPAVLWCVHVVLCLFWPVHVISAHIAYAKALYETCGDPFAFG